MQERAQQVCGIYQKLVPHIEKGGRHYIRFHDQRNCTDTPVHRQEICKYKKILQDLADVDDGLTSGRIDDVKNFYKALEKWLSVKVGAAIGLSPTMHLGAVYWQKKKVPIYFYPSNCYLYSVILYELHFS